MGLPSNSIVKHPKGLPLETLRKIFNALHLNSTSKFMAIQMPTEIITFIIPFTRTFHFKLAPLFYYGDFFRFRLNLPDFPSAGAKQGIINC